MSHVEVSGNDIPILAEQVSVLLRGESGAFLYYPDTQLERFVNPVGLSIIKKADGCCTINDIASFLSSEYEQETSACLADAKSFLADLCDTGMLTFTREKQKISGLSSFPDMKDSPKLLDLSLTRNCNLACSYCFYSNDMHSRQDLPFADWAQFFQELMSLSVRHLVLSGGEVFLRRDLWEIIDEVLKCKMRFSLLTNGTLINDSIISNLLSQGRFRRLDTIQISLDGSKSDVHEKSRGVGSFAKAMRGLFLVREARLPLTVRVTLNRYNYDDIESLAHLLLEEIGLDHFSINDALPIGSGCSNRNSIILTHDQQFSAMKRLAALEKKYPGRIQASAGPLARWHFFQRMESAKETRSKESSMGFLSSCGCAYLKLAVNHDGVIGPCNMISGIELGRINQTPLRDIWIHHPVLRNLRERNRIAMRDLPECKDCEWTDFCRGGCPSAIYHQTGDYNRANPPDCYRLFLEHSEGRKPWIDS